MILDINTVERNLPSDFLHTPYDEHFHKANIPQVFHPQTVLHSNIMGKVSRLLGHSSFDVWHLIDGSMIQG